MKYRFLVNPVADGGRAHGKWQLLKTYLTEQSFDFDVYFSKKPGDIQQYLVELYEDVAQQTIIIMGGDGTLHEAINGALKNTEVKHQIPIAYISAGSGNDFARLYNLPTNPVIAFKKINQKIKQQQFCLIDVGKYVDQRTNLITYFVNNMGIGIDATTVNFVNISQTKRLLNKLHIGNWSYVLAVFKGLVRQDSFEVTMVTAAKQRIYTQKGYLVTIANNPYFGGGVKILPGADPTDGILDIIVVDKPRNIFRLIWLLGALLRGSHYRYPEVNHIKTSQVIIQTEVPEYSHFDGESFSAQSYNGQIQIIKYPLIF